MIPAAAVTRVSRQEQARGVSLEQQAEDIRRYAAFRELEIVAELEDAGVSASVPIAERPAGGQLPELIRTGRVKAVIAYKLDRLFRSVLDCLRTVEEWDKAGVSLHILDMGGQALDTRSSAGRFFLTVMAAVAEMERARISERFRDACAHLRAQGVPMGPPPYGYRYSTTGDRDSAGRLRRELHPEEAEALMGMSTLREAGHTNADIAAYANAYGWPSRSGKWTASSVRAVLATADRRGAVARKQRVADGSNLPVPGISL